jgi:hypothetical protein
MKKILLLFLLYACSCKTVNYQVDNKYKAALNFLDENLHKQYHVVDTLIYISQVNRFKATSDVKKGLSALDSLEALDNKLKFEKEYYNFNRKQRSAGLNVYFSKPTGNKLDVEVMENRGTTKHPYEYLASFNTSVIYTFIFNDSEVIIDVDKQEMIYD